MVLYSCYNDVLRNSYAESEEDHFGLQFWRFSVHSQVWSIGLTSDGSE